MGIIAMLNLFLGLVSIRLILNIDDVYRHPMGADASQAQSSAILKLVICIIATIILNIIIFIVLKKKRLGIAWYKHIIWAIMTFIFPPLFFYTFVYFNISLDNLRNVDSFFELHM